MSVTQDHQPPHKERPGISACIRNMLKSNEEQITVQSRQRDSSGKRRYVLTVTRKKIIFRQRQNGISREFTLDALSNRCFLGNTRVEGHFLEEFSRYLKAVATDIKEKKADVYAR